MKILLALEVMLIRCNIIASIFQDKFDNLGSDYAKKFFADRRHISVESGVNSHNIGISGPNSE